MSRGATSGKVHTVTSIAVGLKNLVHDQNTTVTFTHVDHSDVQFDDKLDVKLEDIHAEYKQGKVFAEGGQGIIREGLDLNLRRPIYRKTAAYGHFGREDADFTWEATNKAAELKAAAGL